MKSYYDYLGVSPQASSDDIRKAYKIMSIKYHPDKHPNPQDKQQATQVFNLINEAYKILSDSVKREFYDNYLRAQHNTERMITEQNQLLLGTQRNRITHLELLRKLDEEEDLIRLNLEKLQSDLRTNKEKLKTKLAEIDEQSLQQSNYEEKMKSEQKVPNHMTSQEEHSSEYTSQTGINNQKSEHKSAHSEQDTPRRSATDAKKEIKARCTTRVSLKGETELHIAIKLKDIKRIISLKLDTFEWVAADHKKQNFIHYIAKYINFDLLHIDEQKYIFNIISNNNELINEQDKNGNIPMHIALKCFNWKLALLLLKIKSNVNIVNKDEKNILHVMLEDMFSEKTIVKQVFEETLKLISDVNARDLSGNTALHYAVANNNNYAVDALLVRGADINIQNEMGDTPLHYAARYGNCHAAIELLKRRAHIVSNKRKEVPLHNAIMVLDVLRPDDIQMQQNIISNLLKASEQQVSCMDCNEWSPLHYAVDNNVLNSAVINLLLDHKAPVNIKNKEGNSPFHFLLTKDRFADFFAAFIAKGADIYLMNEKNESPLLLLIEEERRGEISKLSKLLNMEAGTKIDLNKIYCDGKSILYSALLWGDYMLAKFLMEKGALLNKNDGTPDEILINLRDIASLKEIIDLAEQAINLSFVSKLSEKVSQKRSKSSNEKSDLRRSKRERKLSKSMVNPANIDSALFNRSIPSIAKPQQTSDCDTTHSLRKSGRR